jgi:DNA-binding NarL/FixJ family response regulator
MQQRTTAGPIRVGLATPPGALRAGLRALLSGAAGIEIAAEVVSIEALERMDVPVDVAAATVGAIRRDRSEPYQLPVLLLVEGDVPERELLLRYAGRAWGFLPLEADADTLQAALRALYEGLVVAAPPLLNPLLSNARRQHTDNDGEALTARELEVLQQLALGHTNRQIAVTLGISEHTVKFHISAIYGKLGVMNRAEAVHRGVRRGWIEL